MKELEDQVYATLFALPDPQYIARLANIDRMRRYAPRLREWMLEACGMVRLGKQGKLDASAHRLDLSKWDNGELVLAANESWALLCGTTTPHDEAFLYNLARFIANEVGTRLLRTDPKYRNCIPSMEY